MHHRHSHLLFLKSMKKITLLSCLVAFLGPLSCFAQLSQRETQAISKLERKLAADITDDGLDGGISAAIIKNDRVIWAKAFGYANRDTKRLADTSTIYRIASITKTFTATLLLLLVEDKAVGLDDPAEKYVPEVARIIGYTKDTKFTLRQLASHTSGLKRWSEMRNANFGSIQGWAQKTVSSLKQTRLESKPGKQYLYSDVGFCILGLALERASGQSYMKMIEERIIHPLQMKHTFFAPDYSSLPYVAQGLYNRDGIINTKLPQSQLQGLGYGVPNGGLFSTPKDLAKLISTYIVKSGLLTKASIRKMQQVPKGGKDYGLGMGLDSRKGFNCIGHSGLIPGYASEFFIDNDTKYAVILMRNYDLGSTDLIDAAARLVYDICCGMI